MSLRKKKISMTKISINKDFCRRSILTSATLTWGDVWRWRCGRRWFWSRAGWRGPSWGCPWWGRGNPRERRPALPPRARPLLACPGGKHAHVQNKANVICVYSTLCVNIQSCIMMFSFNYLYLLFTANVNCKLIIVLITFILTLVVCLFNRTLISKVETFNFSLSSANRTWNSGGTPILSSTEDACWRRFSENDLNQTNRDDYYHVHIKALFDVKEQTISQLHLWVVNDPDTTIRV